MTPTSESPEWQAPLFELLSWLEGHCRMQARPYPRLDPMEVQGEALERYLQRAPSWFAAGETRTTPRRRAQDLLKNLVRHIVTEHKREVNRERRRAGVAFEDLDQHAKQIDPSFKVADANAEERREAAFRDARVKQHTLALKNPVYKLTLLGLYLSDDTHNEHFHDAKRAVLRSLDEAWTLFVAERATIVWDNDETHRRWTYGELLRSKTPMRTASPKAARTYYDWLNRTAHRAGIKLRAELEADAEVLG